MMDSKAIKDLQENIFHNGHHVYLFFPSKIGQFLIQ